ncbi:MAG: hypothetical protein AAGF11_30930 [Myxococcota bacterium]
MDIPNIIVASTGAVVVVAGLCSARLALKGLEGIGQVSFSRHWGGLGAGQSGWEISGPLLAALVRLSFATVLVALGVSLSWHACSADDDQQPEANAAH